MEGFADILGKIALEEEAARRSRLALQGIMDYLSCGVAVFTPVGQGWRAEFNSKLPKFVTGLLGRDMSPDRWLDSVGAYLVTGKAGGKSLLRSALFEQQPVSAEVLVTAASNEPRLVLTVVPLRFEDSQGALVLLRYADDTCPCGIDCPVNQELL